MNQGKISILGDRQIMLHASALLELQAIDASNVYAIAKQSSLKNLGGIVEHAKVYGKIKDVFIKELSELGQKIGESNDGTIKTLEELFNIYGLGQMSIRDLNNPGKKVDVAIKDSSLAEEWQLKNKGKKKKVCTLTAGVIAGMFSFIFGKEIDCIETKCKAQGNSCCEFKVG